MMTATFVDLLIIDLATFSFLMAIIPGLAWKVGLAVLLAALTVVLSWQIEPFQVRRGLAAAGCLVCFVALAGLSFAVPTDREDEFLRHQYVSKFARSGVVAAVDLLTRGVLEADATTPDRLNLLADGPGCDAGRKLPHIVMVFDEFELRRHHAAQRQGAARLPRAFPFVRRQDALVRGRGRRRSQLVHRVQRAHRALRALLRALRRVRHQARGRPGQSRIAPCIAKVRLQDLQPLFLVRGLCRRPPFPDQHRHRAFPRRRTIAYRPRRHRQLLLRPCRPGDRPRPRQRSGLRLRLPRGQPFPVGLPLPSRSAAGLGEPGKPLSRSTNICAARR